MTRSTGTTTQKPMTRRRKTAATVGAVRSRGKLTNSAAQAALISPEKPLTDQQRLFVKFWASGESPLSASIKAGYTDGGTYAYRMVRMPNILVTYQAEKSAYERDSGMNRKKVIDGFLEAVDMAKTMAEPATMVAGWREIGKMCGFYEPLEVRHTVSGEVKHFHERLDSMSDSELFEMIAQRSEALSASQTPALPAPDVDDDDGPA